VQIRLNHFTEIATKFFSPLETSEAPQHILQRKIGASELCLRNFTPPIRYAGTVFFVKCLYTFITQATVIIGHAQRENKFTPRIGIIRLEYTFPFNRIQFPVSLLLLHH
jgi:hypothetical protein